jgi:hypothetical protein
MIDPARSIAVDYAVRLNPGKPVADMLADAEKILVWLATDKAAITALK